jgi:hypothetical protein
VPLSDGRLSHMGGRAIEWAIVLGAGFFVLTVIFNFGPRRESGYLTYWCGEATYDTTFTLLGNDFVPLKNLDVEAQTPNGSMEKCDTRSVENIGHFLGLAYHRGTQAGVDKADDEWKDALEASCSSAVRNQQRGIERILCARAALSLRDQLSLNETTIDCGTLTDDTQEKIICVVRGKRC